MTRHASVPRRWLATAFASVVLVAALFWIFFRHEVFPKRFVEVEPGRLFRSGQISPRLIRSTLQDHDIGLVVDLEGDSEDPAHLAEMNAIRRLGIEYAAFPLGGSGVGDPHHYALALAAIDRAQREGTPTLVHCVAGARRSGGVIAMYLLLVEGRSSEESFAELDRYGSPPVDETPLLAFMNDNMGVIARELVALGTLAEVPDPLPRLAGDLRDP